MIAKSKEIDIIQNFINQHYSGDSKKDRIIFFEIVQNFPYQINGFNTPETLLTKKEGYCVSKHRLLKIIYEKLGYQAELCFVPFSFNMVYLPDKLKNWGLAVKKGYHVFLKLWIDDKEIYLDATYNKELKDFYVVNENRDGITSQKMICKFEKIYIPKTEDEEFEIKKKLSDYVGFIDIDWTWINEYNSWIKKIMKIG